MRRIVMLVLVVGIGLGVVGSDAGEAPAATAVILTIDGEATLDGPAPVGTKAAVEMLTLVPDTRILIAPGGSLVLGLIDGRRVRLSEKTEVVVEEEGIRLVRGEVLALGDVPALTRLVPVLVAENACTTRVRACGSGHDALKLRPARGTRVPPGELTLTFEPPEGYGRFRVRLAKEFDSEFLSVETGDVVITVPAGVLEPGVSYDWSVETLDSGQPRLFQLERFAIVNTEVEAARTELIDRLKNDDGRHLAAFLNAVDTALCLDRPFEQASDEPGRRTANP